MNNSVKNIKMSCKNVSLNFSGDHKPKGINTIRALGLLKVICKIHRILCSSNKAWMAHELFE